MARIVSFIVLCAVLLLVGGLFVRVMADFLLPLFMALLLVVIFGPMHRAIERRLPRSKRAAAALSTAVIVAAVLLPSGGILAAAAFQGIDIVRSVQWHGPSNASAAQAAGNRPEDLNESFRPTEAGVVRGDSALGPDGLPENTADESVFNPQGLARALAAAAARLGFDVSADELQQAINSRIGQWLAPLALSTTQWLAQLAVGLFVMVVALYYFLADGPEIIATLMRLSPMDDQYERQLIAQFDALTRAVVLATLLSALSQGLLAGLGYWIAGVGSVMLLSLVTALMAMVPFVGATIVWGPVCLYLYFYEGRLTAAIALAVYCALVVSTIDNVIKPLVLRGGANLHPLLALLSVMGGVQVLGPIGLFIGPMVVAFLQTLLTMFHTELAGFERGTAAVSGAATGPRGERPEG